jgi:hypothetical protein
MPAPRTPSCIRCSTTVADAQLRIAYAARDRYLGNKRTIDWLELAFEAASSR